MKTVAVVVAVLLAVIAAPFAGVLLAGAPPPGARGGSSVVSGNGCVPQTGATVTSVSGAGTRGQGGLPANWKTIAQFLTSHGYTQNAAAGIDGNIQVESGGNPEQLQIGGGGGGGLIQWTPWQGKAQITGNVAADLAQQLGAILAFNNQAGGAAIATLNAEPTAAAAAAYYESSFEHPRSLADAGVRGNNATAVLAALTNGAGGGGGGVTTVTTTTPCPPGHGPPGPPGQGPPGGGAPPSTATGAAATAIMYAKGQLGKPYVWGGVGPDGYDCSGLVMMAWRSAGVTIPRTSQAQWAGLPHITAAQAQPGDLIFHAGADGTLTSPGHVVMNLGSGMVLQAFATGTPVEVSTLASLTSSHLVGYARP